MKISIIIPTLNEAEKIGNLIRYLYQHQQDAVLEIIVSDGGSRDGTIEAAREAGAKLLIAPGQSRAIQMNYGATVAAGDILYFVHADTIPPVSYARDIIHSVKQGFDLGRYRTKFEGNGWLLKLNAFFTRFDLFVCYGGDQTLFIKKEFFSVLKGYDESLAIMEEYDLTTRAKQLGKYMILPKASLVSTRKYDRNSWWQVQRANFIIVKMFKKGLTQDLLVKRYNELIKFR